MTEFIDSHAHLTLDDTFSFSKTEEILKRAKKANIKTIINICTNLFSLEKGIELAKKHRSVFTAAATPPHDTEKEEKSFFSLVEKYAKEKKIVAIGETGLDYYYKYSKKETQKAFFEKYLSLAKDLSLPVIIHCREAFNDLFEITKKYMPFPAVLHCFTGTNEEAKKALENGWYISFSGIITFKNSNALREVVKIVPLEKMLIETDSPYLAPQKYRGGGNEPAYLIETAKEIAKIKNVEIDKVARITSKNARSFFKILFSVKSSVNRYIL